MTFQRSSIDTHDKATGRRIRVTRIAVNHYRIEDAYSRIGRTASLDYIANRYPELSLRDVATLRLTA